MRVKTFYVTFTMEIDVMVVAPENATAEEVQKAAAREADEGLPDWTLPDWDSHVSSEQSRDVDITAFRNKNGYRQVKIPIADCLALDGDAIVAPEDASWLKGLPIDNE